MHVHHIRLDLVQHLLEAVEPRLLADEPGGGAHGAPGEVRARGGELYVFADPRVQFGDRVGIHTMRMPALIQDFQAPIIYTVPLQLLAYHVAVLKGTDVDQPRNLAKSVTVE